MSQSAKKLEKEYLKLLKKHGLLKQLRPFDLLDRPRIIQALMTLITESKGSTAEQGDKPLALSQDFIEDFINVGGSEQRILNSTAEKIRIGVETAGFSMPMEVFVGDFPTSSFNAQACRVRGGALLLINRGLTDLIWHIAKIFSISINVVYRSKDQTIPTHTVKASTFSEEQTTIALAEVVLAYLLRGSPHAVRPLPEQGKFRTAIVTFLMEACARFAVAHEFGHVIDGHLNSAKSILAETAVRKIELVKKDWWQEFMADQIAVQIMMASLNKFDSKEGRKTLIIDGENRSEFEFLIAAPLVFLAIDKMVNRIYLELHDLRDVVIITDHPPSDARMGAILQAYQGLGINSDQIPQWVDALMEWLFTKEESAAQVVRQLIYSVFHSRANE